MQLAPRYDTTVGGRITLRRNLQTASCSSSYLVFFFVKKNVKLPGVPTEPPCRNCAVYSAEISVSKKKIVRGDGISPKNAVDDIFLSAEPVAQVFYLLVLLFFNCTLCGSRPFLRDHTLALDFVAVASHVACHPRPSQFVGDWCTVGVLAGTHQCALRCPGKMTSETERQPLCGCCGVFFCLVTVE